MMKKCVCRNCKLVDDFYHTGYCFACYMECFDRNFFASWFKHIFKKKYWRYV